MRRTLGFLVCIMLIAAACTKTGTVGLTTAEQLDKDINLIDEYIASKGLTVVSLDNGVRYSISELGTGALPTAKNCVRFRFKGYVLYDTAAFGVSPDEGTKSSLVGLVAGMQVGMHHMPVGTKGTVYMPSGFAYGASGRRDASGNYVIPPNSCLWFDVEILELYDYNTAGNYCYE